MATSIEGFLSEIPHNPDALIEALEEARTEESGHILFFMSQLGDLTETEKVPEDTINKTKELVELSLTPVLYSREKLEVVVTHVTKGLFHIKLTITESKRKK